jgi:hypothetical protein
LSLLCIATVAFLAWWGPRRDMPAPSLVGSPDTGGSWSAAAVAATKTRGDVVADAIERFRKNTNRYPQSLAELAPTHLYPVPAPAVGNRQWRYRVANGSHGFILSVTGNAMADPELYRTADGSWVLDDK